MDKPYLQPASASRTVSLKNRENLLRVELENIISQISRATYDGRFNISFTGRLEKDTLKTLERAGYIVVVLSKEPHPHISQFKYEIYW